MATSVTIFCVLCEVRVLGDEAVLESLAKSWRSFVVCVRVSVCPCVRPSASLEQLGVLWTNFHEDLRTYICVTGLCDGGGLCSL